LGSSKHFGTSMQAFAHGLDMDTRVLSSIQNVDGGDGRFRSLPRRHLPPSGLLEVPGKSAGTPYFFTMAPVDLSIPGGERSS